MTRILSPRIQHNTSDMSVVDLTYDFNLKIDIAPVKPVLQLPPVPDSFTLSTPGLRIDDRILAKRDDYFSTFWEPAYIKSIARVGPKINGTVYQVIFITDRQSAIKAGTRIRAYHPFPSNFVPEYSNVFVQRYSRKRGYEFIRATIINRRSERRIGRFITAPELFEVQFQGDGRQGHYKATDLLHDWDCKQERKAPETKPKMLRGRSMSLPEL